MPIPRGYSAYSSGPIMDTTPKDDSSTHISITDSPFAMSPYGPPYEIAGEGPCVTCGGAHEGACDSDFTKLEHKLANKPGVTNPAALAAKIGVEKIGQAEMTRRSVEAREKD
jgi:hypothetical protein